MKYTIRNHKKNWLAEITGKDSEYGLAREFLTYNLKEDEDGNKEQEFELENNKYYHVSAINSKYYIFVQNDDYETIEERHVKNAMTKLEEVEVEEKNMLDNFLQKLFNKMTLDGDINGCDDIINNISDSNMNEKNKELLTHFVKKCFRMALTENKQKNSIKETKITDNDNKKFKNLEI